MLNLKEELLSRYEIASKNYKQSKPELKAYYLGQLHLLESIMTQYKIVDSKQIIEYKKSYGI